MTRKPAFTCCNHAVSDRHLLLYCLVYVMFLVLIPIFVSPVVAAETKIFTDADLGKYNAGPMVDQETASRSEADLNSYITRRSAESLLEKEAVKKEEIRRQQIEEVKRSVVQRKKVTVSQMPVSVPQKRVIAAQTTGSVQRSTGRT